MKPLRALSDATRRGVLGQLGRVDASITDLAEKFRLTLTGMKKHVGVLEQAVLVTTEKVGRVRNCKLGPRRLEEEAMWVEGYRQLWEARFETMGVGRSSQPSSMKNRMSVERKSERELVVTRTVPRRVLEVTPPSRLVWTNEEAGGNGQVTTLTAEERAGQTLLVVHDLYPSKEALDEEVGSGSTGWNDETFDQLDELLGSATDME